MGAELDLEYISSLAFPAALAFFAFLIRFSIKKEKIVILTFLLDIIATVFVGVLVSIVIDDYRLPNGAKWGAVTMASMLGPELLAGMLHIAAMFSRSPVTFVIRIIRAVRGKPLTPEELKDMVKWERDFIKEIRRERDN